MFATNLLQIIDSESWTLRQQWLNTEWVSHIQTGNFFTEHGNNDDDEEEDNHCGEDDDDNDNELGDNN